MIKTNIKLLLLTTIFCTQLALPSFSMEDGMEDNAQNRTKHLINKKKEEIDRRNKKINKAKDELKELESIFERLNITTTNVLQSPPHSSSSSVTPPQSPSHSSSSSIFVSPDRSKNISTVQRILDEELKGKTQEQKIGIVSPNIKVGTNATNILKNIHDGKRTDSPPEKCIESFLTWENQER